MHYQYIICRMTVGRIGTAESYFSHRLDGWDGNGHFTVAFLPNSNRPVDLFLAFIGVFNRQVYRNGLTTLIDDDDR